MSPQAGTDPRRSIVRLAVAVLAADGRITPDELATLESLDELGLGRISDFAESEIQRAVDAPIDVASTCAALPTLSSEGATLLVAVLAGIAGSDGAVSPREEAVLRTIGTCFGLRAGATEEILAGVRAGCASTAPRERPGSKVEPRRTDVAPPREAPEERQAAAPSPARPSPSEGTHESRLDEYPPAAEANLAHALSVLGLEPGAGRAELDAAYRAIVERYDPARVLDLGTEFAALAVHKLVRATAAFEAVLATLQPPS